MKKVLFIDRDGTIIIEPEDEQVDSFIKLEFYPGAITTLHRIATELDFELVMVTNQDGLGTMSFPEKDFWPVHNFMMKTLENEQIRFVDVLIDRTMPAQKATTRKPGTALLEKYIKGDYDLANSFVIGDRSSDVQLADNLGTRAILLGSENDVPADLVTRDWNEIYNYLRLPQRSAEVHRKTIETDIRVNINIDGEGNAKINTGIGFFDHMLELLAHHAACDLQIEAIGDLQVDEHHTVEDTALALGEAIRNALGDKKGIERYGFLLPMDESVAEVAIDFSGRPWLQWEIQFKREKIGEMPTEMFYHFFKSFCDSARCNLYVKAQGSNEHHKIEGIFKAIARALKMAFLRNPAQHTVPSSKGIL
jgi:imidazoleglycerol-phosphate dehydratase/histidinol-phosphatase